LTSDPSVAKGDVAKLCEHVRELIYELNAVGEMTNDLLSNLARQSSGSIVHEEIRLGTAWK
jgi:hypothetical protein